MWPGMRDRCGHEHVTYHCAVDLHYQLCEHAVQFILLESWYHVTIKSIVNKLTDLF